MGCAEQTTSGTHSPQGLFGPIACIYLLDRGLSTVHCEGRHSGYGAPPSAREGVERVETSTSVVITKAKSFFIVQLLLGAIGAFGNYTEKSGRLGICKSVVGKSTTNPQRFPNRSQCAQAEIVHYFCRQTGLAGRRRCLEGAPNVNDASDDVARLESTD